MSHNCSFSFVCSNYVKIFLYFVDCCDTSVTGEEKIKGVMIWPTTVADTNLTIPCPYKINDTTVKYAVRECESDFIRGPQWVEPNIDECPYKTKTTQQLEALSEVRHSVLTRSCFY